MLRGLEKVKMQATLTFACMNLKKLAIWKHRKKQPKPPVHGKNSFCEKIKYRLLYKALPYLSTQVFFCIKIVKISKKTGIFVFTSNCYIVSKV